jgi:23S rRNA (guanosine2251-2'-O)-methyltransferase
VEGRRAVLELLRARRRVVRRVLLAAAEHAAGELDEIERLARRAGARVEIVAAGRLRSAAATSAPQGVVAFADDLDPLDLDALASLPGPGGPPLVVVLDGLTDPQNLGALVRTAVHFGASGFVLPKHRSVHVTPAAAKVAAGGVEHAAFALVPGVPAGIQRLQRLGLRVIGLAPEAGTPLASLGAELRVPVALVLGGEARGLAALTRRRCDLLASIPRSGPIEALNVASAGAIALYEAARARVGGPRQRRSR